GDCYVVGGEPGCGLGGVGVDPHRFDLDRFLSESHSSSSASRVMYTPSSRRYRAAVGNDSRRSASIACPILSSPSGPWTSLRSGPSTYGIIAASAVTVSPKGAPWSARLSMSRSRYLSDVIVHSRPGGW